MLTNALLDLTTSNSISFDSFQDVISDRLYNLKLGSFIVIYSISNNTGNYVIHTARKGWRTIVTKSYLLNMDDKYIIIEANYDNCEELNEYLPISTFFILSLNDTQINISIFKRLLDRLYINCLEKKRIEMRGHLVQATMEKSDIGSFLHKVLIQAVISFFHAEAGSIFYQDPRNGFLFLGATTDLQTQKYNDTKKMDVFYTKDSKSWVMKCFSESRPIYEEDHNGNLKQGRYMECVKEGVYSRIYYPIKIQKCHKYMDSSIETIGVIRIVNPKSIAAKDYLYKGFLSWEDEYILDFLSEVIAVQSVNYIRSRLAQYEVEQTVHGFTSTTDGIKNNVAIIKRHIFGMDVILPFYKKYLLPSYKYIGREGFQENNVINSLNTINSIVYELQHQIDKVQKSHIKSFDVTSCVDKLFSEVLQKVVNNKKAIAEFNDKQDLVISNLIDAGATKLPPVVGEVGGLISIFRNLFENSAKYAKEDDKRPKIDIKLEFSRDFVYIFVQDYGIGIQQKEVKHIFTEGFRGEKARRLTNRGGGIGLPYSRDVSRIYQGDILLTFSDVGSCFVVKLKRWYK